MAVDLICKKEVKTPEAESAEQTAAQPDEKDDPVIVCRNCNSIVTKPRFQVEIDNRFSHTFANPHGIVFEIGCFSKADGCVKASDTTDEFSWFNGYVWAIVLCRNCRCQLGWIFIPARSGQGASFFGLILDQLVFP